MSPSMLLVAVSAGSAAAIARIIQNAVQDADLHGVFSNSGTYIYKVCRPYT